MRALRLLIVALLAALAFPAAGLAAPTFNMVGNEYPSVPHSADDLAVASDGVAVTGGTWVEDGHEVAAYKAADGAPVGPHVGLHQTGGAVGADVTMTDIWAVNGGDIVRWPRSAFMAMSGSSTRNNPYMASTSRYGVGGTLKGIAVCASSIYVTNGSSVLQRTLTGGAVRSWSVANAEHVDCDRQGNVWVLQTGSPRSLAHFSSTGAFLGVFNVTGIPLDVAADPTSDTVLVSDNGPDQDVERYDYGGNLVGRVGVQGGYLAGPDPGLIGPDRFAGPRGVAVDGVGNVYVSQGGRPNTTETRATSHIISKLTPAGSEQWRHYGLHSLSNGEATADRSRLYSTYWSYTNQNGQWVPRAYTADPFNHPEDRPWQEYEWLTTSRKLGGQEFVIVRDVPDGVTFLKRQGELLVPSTVLIPGGNNGQSHLQVPGRANELPTTITGSCGPNADTYIEPENGNLWMACQGLGGIHRLRFQGLTAGGDPIYTYAEMDNYATPSATVAKTTRVEAHNGDVYLSGSASGEPTTGFTWQWTGPRLAKYALPSGSTFGAPIWNRTLPQSGQDGPVSWAVDGNSVAVMQQADPNTNAEYVRMLDAGTGADAGRIDPPLGQLGKIGWADMTHSILFKDGVQYWEEDGEAKILEVCVSGTCPAAP
jgi:hypothetical protein